MTDIIDYISTWSVLKWVIIVLVAGFIGQFGKMLASAIVRKISRARSKKQADFGDDSPSAKKDFESPAAAIPKDTKVESNFRERYPDKKALKIASKASKKAAGKSK
jgi:hypothetical protein